MDLDMGVNLSTERHGVECWWVKLVQGLLWGQLAWVGDGGEIYQGSPPPQVHFWKNHPHNLQGQLSPTTTVGTKSPHIDLERNHPTPPTREITPLIFQKLIPQLFHYRSISTLITSLNFRGSTLPPSTWVTSGSRG